MRDQGRLGNVNVASQAMDSKFTLLSSSALSLHHGQTLEKSFKSCLTYLNLPSTGCVLHRPFNPLEVDRLTIPKRPTIFENKLIVKKAVAP